MKFYDRVNELETLEPKKKTLRPSATIGTAPEKTKLTLSH